MKYYELHVCPMLVHEDVHQPQNVSDTLLIAKSVNLATRPVESAKATTFRIVFPIVRSVND